MVLKNNEELETLKKLDHDDLNNIIKNLKLKKAYRKLKKNDKIEKILNEGNPKTLKYQLFGKPWYLKPVWITFIFSILIAILIAYFFFILPEPNQLEHQNTTKYINETSITNNAKLDLLIDNEFEEILKYEGVSLDQIRILKQESGSISSIYFDKGIENIQENKLEEAFDNFNTSVIMDENNSVGWSNLGTCLLLLNGINSSEEALKYLYRAYELNPNNSGYNFNIGYTLFEISNENPEAIKYLENATQLDPNDLIAWKYLAMSSFFAGNHTKSKIAMEKVSPIRKYDEHEKLLWGIKLRLSQEYDNFEVMSFTYDNAINNCTVCDDYMEVLWYNKAVIFLQINDYEQMKISLNKVLEINPERRSEILKIYLKWIGAEDKRVKFNDLGSVNEIRLTNEDTEIPCLVYNESIINEKIISANVVFFTINNESEKYTLSYGNPKLIKPQYRFRENSNTTFMEKPLNLLWYYVDKKLEIEY